ncbi:hypothetical protein EVAR_17905_1 [Eumeta japonica]|uniref:FLYWCH-type domain-containing protein n=1 Tax=Eumeta variegata TaxID=151549 RepID=A0A4C1UZG7_EUMVA|nr:hypothetical protein EVAR_17905_1 [Eumeta japonica]
MESILVASQFDPDDIEFILSKRGRPLIKIGKYIYRKQSLSGVKTRWVCSTHGHKKCYAVLYTVEGEVVRTKNVHNH